VVLDTWKIDKANINKLYILFLDVGKNFCRILKHFSPDLGLVALGQVLRCACQSGW
jgi:hypothetical protein